MTARDTLNQAMSEQEWTATVIGTPRNRGLARTLGWTCLHVNDSRREVVDRHTGEHKLVGDTDAAGLPDWLLIRERVVFVELKRQRGISSDTQIQILGALLRAGAEAYVWRPSDYAEVERTLRERR